MREVSRVSWLGPWVSLGVPGNGQDRWKALEILKRQDGVGATPKGSEWSVRPYDSRRASYAIFDLKSWRGVGNACPTYLLAQESAEEAEMDLNR